MVKCRIPILIIAIALLIPSVLGMAGTRINYDMLDYLPADMDTVIGQNELMEEFGKGAFSMLVIENMPEKDVAELEQKIKQVDHVDSVVWYDSIADLSVPMQLLPAKYTTSSTPTTRRLWPCSSIRLHPRTLDGRYPRDTRYRR